jgi:hypothetical protein
MAVSRVPHELWEGVRSFLPYFSSHALSRVMYKPSAEDDHSRIWNYFFKSDEWLNFAAEAGANPCLVGYDLYPLLHDKHEAFNVTKKTRKPKYLALVFGRDGSDRASETLKGPVRTELLLKSLHPFESKTDHEVVFANGTILNINDLIWQDWYTIVSCPRQLVSRRLDGLHSAYIYWKDMESRVREIKPEDIVGIGKGRTKKNVSRIFRLKWKNLPSGKEHQHVFNTRGMYIQARPVITNGKITSYEWEPEWKLEIENKLTSNVLGRVLKRMTKAEDGLRPSKKDSM